jgi:flagellar FliL protein
MAETEEKQPQQAPAAKGGKSKLILALVAVVVLGGLGGGAYVMLGKGGDAEAAKHGADDGGHKGSKDGKHGKEGKGSEKGAPDAEDAIVALDTFVVNLADENAQRYLKVTMKVEFFGPEAPPRFAARQAQIRDLLLSLLGSKTVADVRTIEGKQQLRDEVMARISRVIEEDVVKAVYFAEFIVQ